MLPVVRLLALCVLCATSMVSLLCGGDAPTQTAASDREALARFNDFIGGWKGVGQIKRNSTQGAWRETSEFVWKIDKHASGIEYRVKDGKHLKSGLLSWDAPTKQFKFTAENPDGTKLDHFGKFEDNALVLESKPKTDGSISRITIRQLNELRLLVLYESRKESQSLYQRIGEVGYTREGAKLASSDQTGPVCVVSGGVGTIKVSYKGETYFVCCTGCRDAFNDDPETFLTEYKARLEKKKAMKN